MKQKTPNKLAPTDQYAANYEDESVAVAEENPNITPSMEKNLYPQHTDPEQEYEAEQLIHADNTNFQRLAAKEEMDQLTQFREEQEQQEATLRENPVNQTPISRLPQQALPPRSPQSVQSPDKPGMQTGPPVPAPQPQGPQNPFAQPAPAKPESGLPWKPKGYRKHDCLTVHGMQKHEDWESEQEKKFFRQHKKRVVEQF